MLLYPYLPIITRSWQDVLVKSSFKLYGIRNHQAKNNISKMQPGDEVLFYHGPSGKQIYGIMHVIKSAYLDPTTNAPGWLAINFGQIKTFDVPVTLDQIKAEPALQSIALVKQPRLSVMPLSKQEFEVIVNRGTLPIKY